MTKLTTTLYLSLTLSITSSVSAAPINAVIGLSSSQITELNQGVSLTPNNTSILPLDDDFLPFSFPQDEANSNWINEIGSKVKVEHRLRDLSYTGTLIKVEANSNSFLLNLNNRPILLPLKDFYLIPLSSHTLDKSNQTYPSNLSYQSNQLSWTPQLSLIVSNNDIRIHQNALLHNHSDASIELKDSLLHYSRSQSPARFQAERASMMLKSSSPPAEYQDNEATYPLGNHLISLAPHSNTLYPLKMATSKVEQAIHTASLYTRNNNRGKIDLLFQSRLKFTFTEDGLPGEYQVYWQRGNLLIPANKTFFNTVRANQTASIITNKSLDLTGDLTLISASSRNRPVTQVWEAMVRNNSSKPQRFSIMQNIDGVLEQVEGGNSQQLSANRLELSGQVKSHSTKTIRYTLKLKPEALNKGNFDTN